MTNKTLQYLIYNRLYSASMYELLATQAPTNINQGSFKKNIYWMLEYEGSSTKIFCSESFNANNDEQIKNLTSYISSIIDQRNTKLTNIYLNILDEEIANK